MRIKWPSNTGSMLTRTWASWDIEAEAGKICLRLQLVPLLYTATEHRWPFAFFRAFFVGRTIELAESELLVKCPSFPRSSQRLSVLASVFGDSKLDQPIWRMDGGEPRLEALLAYLMYQQSVCNPRSNIVNVHQTKLHTECCYD